jgi:hypothetical protein
MTIHQCPKCELRFDFKTELDDHCWHDHPEFRHEYPVQHPAAEPPAPMDPAAHLPPAPHPTVVARFLGWVLPQQR